MRSPSGPSPKQDSSRSPTANTGGGTFSGNATTQEYRLPNGQFGRATVNPNGTTTVSNNNGSVTLSKSQMERVAAGDMSPMSALMGKLPSTTLSNTAPIYEPPSRLERFVANLPSIPQPIANAVAGFGDVVSNSITMGLWSTADYRKSAGLESYVDTKSTAYKGGEIAGHVWEVGTLVAGGAGAVSSSARTGAKSIGAAENAMARSLAAEGKVANAVPETLARVIPDGIPTTTLGKPGAADVFVTAADDIAGKSAAQIAERLAIPNNPTGFKVIEFPTPQSGVASPVFRTDPGFIGGGRTAGGAREFVIPNQPVPAGATTRIVQ